MRKLLYLFFLTCFAFVPWDASAQVISLPTVTNQNNGSGGILFEATASRALTVKRLHVYNSGTGTAHIWATQQAMNNNVNTGNGWSLIGSAAVTSSGNPYSEIPVDLDYVMQPGLKYCFFITGISVRYTNGTSVAANTYADNNLSLNCYGYGGGSSAPTNPTFFPRVFNGQVDYILAGATNDIGIASIDSVTAACPGQQDIYATVQNFGSNVINSATINWSWNGVAQAPIALPTALDTFGGTGVNSVSVFLGTRTFAAGAINDITVSATNPNGGVDTVAFNNSITDQLAASLTGSFTINTGLPTGSGNFNSVQSAVAALNTWGVCGPVVFNMAPGAYVGQFTMGSITGASATNTITFKPAPTAAGDVTIAFNATSSSNPHIVRFQGASYITLEGLKFRPLGTSYQRSIEFNGANDHITIKNCKFENNPTSTSTYFSHLYNQSGSANKTEFCTIEGNEFKGGSYSVYWYGGSSSNANQEDGNDFINNTFEDFYYIALYAFYQKNSDVIGNTVMARTANRYSTNFGIYRYYNDFGSVLNNKIVVAGTSTNYGLYMRNNYGDASNKVRVENNMVSALDNSGTTYGLYTYNCRHNNIYHNTVHVNKGAASSSGRPIYGWCSSSIYGPNEIVNNTFTNTGGGYACYIYNRYNCFTALNNNNFYTNSTGSFAYYRNSSSFTSTRSSFAALQTAMGGLGANNISVAPLFVSNRDLHTITPAFDGAGATGTGVTEDIDGETRCPGAGCPGNLANPDIGADEFDPPAVDAAVLDVSLPCPGVTDVLVTVQNRGINPLNSVTIVATVNGTPTSGSGGTFNVGGLAPGATAVVNVGSFTFTSGTSYTISATSSDPNGLQDPNTGNDNYSSTGFPSLGGVLTVGGANPDYPTINAAIADMENSGICGPTWLHLREGVYNEQVTIGSIPGASAANPVVIMPDPANTLPVEIAYTATSFSNAAVMRFEGASHITMKDIMVSPTGTSYQRGIELYGSNDYLTFDGLTIQNNPTSTSTYYSLFYNISGTGNLTNNTTIQNCTLIGGSYALYWYGGSSSTHEQGNKFLNNSLTGYYYAGLWWYYQKNTVVDGNEIKAREGAYTFNYALRSYYSDEVQYTNNVLVAHGRSTNYGLYMWYNDGASSNYNQVANNMISCLDNSSSSYPLYVYNNRYTNIYHNSTLVNKGSSSSTGSTRVYIYGSSSIYGPINFVNNSIANLGGGPAVYIYNRRNIMGAMDNNNYYGAGTYLGYYYPPSGSAGYVRSLADWQARTGSKDQNSISVNPSYDGLTDLHVSNIQMDGAGAPGTGVTTDIDGEARCPGNGCPGGAGLPDIGADEYEVPPIDAGISDMINPVNGLGCDYRPFEPVVVTITNYGSEALNFALNPATVSVTVSGASTQSFSVNLPPLQIPVGGSINWPVGVLNMTNGGVNIITTSISVVGDGKAKNNSYVREIEVAIISNFPYTENFDSWNTCGTGASTVCPLESGWTNEYTDDMDWLVDANGTSSSGTGPARDVSGNGNYLYIEASFPNYPSKEAVVNMPCVNVAGMTCPVLSFAYHMYGANTGKLSVEIFDGVSWNSVYSLSGQQQSGNNAPWEYAQVPLDNYVNTGVIKIRFVGSVGSQRTWTSDIAIDEISLLDLATDFVLTNTASQNTATTCDVVDFNGFSNVGLLVQKWNVVGGVQGRDWTVVSGSMRDRNLSIAFTTPGTYRVTFSGSALCNQYRADTETITVTSGRPNSDFTVNKTVGTQAVDVFTFTDQTSPNPTDWLWQVALGRTPAVENIDFAFVNSTKNSRNPSMIFLKPGRFSIRLTVGTICGIGGESKQDYINVTALRPNAVGISNSEERLSQNEINITSVYPNPFTDHVKVDFISLSEENAELKLANMVGKTIHTEVLEDMVVGQKSVKLDLPENLSAGVYILSIRQGTRNKTIKLIKE